VGTRLHLLAIKTGEEGAGQYIHSDVYALTRLLGIFDFTVHKSRRDRTSILRLRKDALEVQEQQQEEDFIDLDADQLEMLKAIFSSPSDHLKSHTTVEGKEIPVRDEILADVFVVSGMENMLRCLNGEPGLYEAHAPTPDEAQPLGPQ
jgi:hypothetical protein